MARGDEDSVPLFPNTSPTTVDDNGGDVDDDDEGATLLVVTIDSVVVDVVTASGIKNRESS